MKTNRRGTGAKLIQQPDFEDRILPTALNTEPVEGNDGIITPWPTV